MLREKVRFEGRNVSIKIPIEGQNDFVGYQQNINDFVEEETGLSINAVDDGEKLRYLPSNVLTYRFKFYNGVTHTTDLTDAGFTTDEISNREDSVTKSFYIVQVYDSKSTENQTLLHSGYYNGFKWVRTYEDSTTYTALNSNVEFTNWYLPNNYIETITGTTVTTLYARFYFYNAKTGALQVFYNEDNEALTTEDFLYFDVSVNLVNKTFSFIGSPTILDIKETTNAAFIEKVNETLDSFSVQKTNYPDGDLFNNDGDYEFIDDL